MVTLTLAVPNTAESETGWPSPANAARQRSKRYCTSRIAHGMLARADVDAIIKTIVRWIATKLCRMCSPWAEMWYVMAVPTLYGSFFFFILFCFLRHCAHSNSHTTVYIVPLVPAAGEKKLYIKALEQRVAELESQLASLGQRGVGEDHLRLRASSTMLPPHEGETLYHLAPLPKVTQTQHAGSPTVADDDDDERDDILVAVRDLSLSASGHYVGAASNITIGRVLSSVVHSLQPPRPVSSSLPSSNSAFPTSRLAGGGRRRQEAESHDNPNPNSQNSQNSQQPQHDDNDPTPKSLCTTTRMADMIGVPFLSPQVAQRLMHGWFTHIATRYPVLLTPKVLALHESRDWLVDVYEKSILHLIYAVSGRWLESVSLSRIQHHFSL